MASMPRGYDDGRLVPCPRCGEPMAEDGACAACAAWDVRDPDAASSPRSASLSHPGAVESSPTTARRPGAGSGLFSRETDSAAVGRRRSPWTLVGLVVLLILVAAGVAVYVTVFHGAQTGVRTSQEQLYYADVAKAQTRIQSQDVGQITVLQSLGTEPPADQLAAADQACTDIQAVYAEWDGRAAPSERLVEPTAAWVAAMGKLAAATAPVRAAIASADHTQLPAAVNAFSNEVAMYVIASQSLLALGR